MEVEVNGIVYESEQENKLACGGCIAEYNLVLCDAFNKKVGCANDHAQGLIWKIKEVKDPINNFK